MDYIAAQKHFGGKNNGGLAAVLHSKSARIIVLADKTLAAHELPNPAKFCAVQHINVCICY